MARYAYIRVSTDKQSYDQQVQDIKAYGIDLDTLDGITEEKMTSNKGYEDRAFNSLLKKCKSGDIIYAASTDRIGRDFFDMMKLMKEAAKDGIEIIACKQNLSIARDDVATRIIVAITAIMDEDEKKRIQHRTANKKAWQREQIAKYGYFIIENGPNAGQKCTYVGSPKGHDTSKAREAAYQAAQDAKIRWMEESKGVQWVRAQIAKGKSRTLILEEFNEMHALDPENYSTREGKPLSKGVLSKWCREMNPLAV
ncbi:recombinase family protein [Muribaculum intestinale]|uniref:recombinase family protein n=1 Tax=Muribaculum intestinale TaxID=1796646 RepID=UPI0025B3DA56|nr:recombinase family protein [Muribaculum intestinale]